jgi:hypothetical protein
MMYVALVFVLLAAAFAFSCWRWFKANPILPLNYEYEKLYRTPSPAPRPSPVNFHQGFASSAVSYALTANYVDPRVVQIVAPSRRTWR